MKTKTANELHWQLGTSQPSPVYGRVHQTLAEVRMLLAQGDARVKLMHDAIFELPIKPACENE